MKNRRKKRKRTTPQRPVISEDINTVIPPFMHNQLCITLPEGVFRNLEHYGRFVSETIGIEDLPAHYGTLIQPTDDPGKVTLCVKSDPHSLAEQLDAFTATTLMQSKALLTSPVKMRLLN